MAPVLFTSNNNDRQIISVNVNIMEGVNGLHAEFADDATVVNSDSTVSGACEKANSDLKVQR